MFSGGLESTVYDPTYEHADVEVLNEWDQGIYTLGWDAGFGEFENAEWKVTANQHPGLTMSGQQIFRSIALLSKGTVVPTSLVVEFIGGCRLRCRGTEDLQ